MRRWVWVAVLVLGAVGVATGAALVAAPHGPATFGWTAYSPLSHSVSSPPSPVLPLVAAIALLAISAFAAGAATAVLWTGRPAASRRVDRSPA